MAKRPTLEHDLITWAETHLPQSVGFVRAQSGVMRHKALARIFVRRFQVDRGWGNGFESWIEDMPPQWLSDFFSLSPHLPPPPSTSSWGESEACVHDACMVSLLASRRRERQSGQREQFAIGGGA